MTDEETLAHFRAHLDRCAEMIKRPMRTNVCVTIIVRAPEAFPSEAHVSTNDSLVNARDALDHLIDK